jgi:hypothetical protein
MYMGNKFLHIRNFGNAAPFVFCKGMSIMRREPVDSEAIAAWGYDERQRILEVEFAPGSIYQYFDVPPEDIEEMREAESTGGWFNAIFKPKGYRYQEISGRVRH